MNTPSDQPNRYAAPQAKLEEGADDSNTGHLAGRGARFGSAMLDGTIILTATYLPMLLSGGFSVFAKVGKSANPNNPISVYGALFSSLTGTTLFMMFLGTLLLLGLNAYFVSKNGQSIGKKLVGIKVISSDGSRASLARIFFLRNLLGSYVLSLIPFVGRFYGLIDSLFIFGEQRRCIHDYIADTIVVKA